MHHGRHAFKDFRRVFNGYPTRPICFDKRISGRQGKTLRNLRFNPRSSRRAARKHNANTSIPSHVLRVSYSNENINGSACQHESDATFLL
jgi:hypothetical protein